jgi:spermidine synthase
MAQFREIEDDISRDYMIPDGGRVIKFKSDKAQIVIADTNKFGPMLFMDGVLQLATSDEYIYHEMLVHPVMSTVEAPKNICILGGADGCAIREVLRYSSVEHVDLVDWDTKLIEYLKVNARMWHQGSLYDPRIHIHNLNVTDFASSLKYDVVIVDLFDPEYKDFNPNELWTSLFPKLKAFREGGASIVINGGGVLPWKFDTFEKLVTSASDISSNILISYKVFVPSFSEEWAFVLLSDKIPNIAEDMYFRFCSNTTFRKAGSWEKPYGGI